MAAGPPTVAGTQPLRMFPPVRPMILMFPPFRVLAAVLALSLGAGLVANPPARAQSESGALPLPRFASLGSGEINVRSGPGPQYPIAWKYVRAGLPVEIVAEFEYWRRIRDIDGTVGWVHKSLLSGKRTAVVAGNDPAVLRAEADEAARAVARLEPGVVVRLARCGGPWCKVEVQSFSGWLPRSALWGVYAAEELR